MTHKVLSFDHAENSMQIAKNSTEKDYSNTDDIKILHGKLLGC